MSSAEGITDKTPAPFRVGGGRRVILRDGQRITGQLLGLSKATLMLRTAWAERLELPRSAVASVDSLPGWRTVVDEHFHDGLKAFTTTGEPTLSEAQSVILRSVGQKLTYTLAQPLPAGRVGVNFKEQGQARGARWALEMLFQHGERAQRLTVSLAGDGEHYAVQTGAMKGAARQVARTAGWHRLIVQFSKRALRVTCDDDVLWYNLDQGSDMPLKQVTMHCQRVEDTETVRGSVAWSEFCIERAVVERPKPSADAEQDEVRLLDDDQLFGRIVQADRHVLHLEGRFGKRALPWTQVSGCSFRRAAEAPKANEKPSVRLRVLSGLCAEPDVLEGIVTATEERRLILRHALLGEVTLPRSRVREVQPLPQGAK